MHTEIRQITLGATCNICKYKTNVKSTELIGYRKNEVPKLNDLITCAGSGTKEQQSVSKLVAERTSK